MNADELLSPAKEQAPGIAMPCHVRLTRSYWSDKRGVHQRTSLTILRRRGSDWIEEDWQQIGEMDFFLAVTNLSVCKDGIYQIVPCNEKRDWESGMIEEYDYKLIKVQQ